ncbi:hypothetical protein GGR51DRAFT_540751 [Nemania sp. FL0031]|nr:hypothetical protein GGR51DRAFT_540751 [Nemania sp. FL0031]
MNVAEILHVPNGELCFILPTSSDDQIDKRFEHLRVERRGLRLWTSFEENSEYLQPFLLQTLTQVSHGWKPHIGPWNRLASSEVLVLNLYHLTVIQRVNIALRCLPQTINTSLIGAATTFSSYGTENNMDGETYRRIIPDLLAVDGNPEDVHTLSDPDILKNKIIVAGDAKLKAVQPYEGDTRILPGTIACLESYLAQPVQYCIDLDIRFGFLLTNFELVIFQLVRQNPLPRDSPIKTRSSCPITSPSKLPSDHTDGGIFSSPMRDRKTNDWVRFSVGDTDIDLITVTSPSRGQQQYSSQEQQLTSSQEQQFPSSPPTHDTPYRLPLQELSSPVSSQTEMLDQVEAQLPPMVTELDALEQQLVATPPNQAYINLTSPASPGKYSPVSPLAGKKRRDSRFETGGSLQLPPSQHHENLISLDSQQHQDFAASSPEPEGDANNNSTMASSSQRSFLQAEKYSQGDEDNQPDPRSLDPTHVLIRSYPVNSEDIALRLFELIVLAKEARMANAHRIGPNKVSLSVRPPTSASATL